MIFFHEDTGNSYNIPPELCDINLFKTEGNNLILSTGERVEFTTREFAEVALILFEECFRDLKSDGCFWNPAMEFSINEATTGYGYCPLR